MCDNHSSYLRNVYLAADVYAACLQHALSTEKEEVMGLLIGEVNEVNCTSNISACVILHRSDKQPDRVEISPEQLCNASTHAEQLAITLDRPMRVLGWYHSHPHITVWPSHVDLRTQAMYQTMDPLFVGIIFSVFSTDTDASINKIEMTCFQALSTGSDPSADPQRREVALTITPSPLTLHNLEAITDLPHILTQEVEDNYKEYDCSKDNLTELHNTAFKALEISHIVSKVSLPMAEELLKDRLLATEARIKVLQLLKTDLLSKIKE